MESFAPALAIICLFGLPIGGWIAKSYFSHRERMELIRQGINPRDARRGRAAAPGPRPVPPWEGRTTWQNMPPPIVVAADESCASDPQRRLHRGILTTAIGVALLIGLSFIDYSSTGGPFGGPRVTPGPWLLGGLIPMFVGIAQMIIALLSGAELPFARASNASWRPSSGSGPTANYPGANHVGPNVEELKRPTPPPAQRG